MINITSLRTFRNPLFLLFLYILKCDDFPRAQFSKGTIGNLHFFRSRPRPTNHFFFLLYYLFRVISRFEKILVFLMFAQTVSKHRHTIQWSCKYNNRIIE
ncbi:hypothetical protein Hanom_Chr06g00532751 [Helianthus anomalus]